MKKLLLLWICVNAHYVSGLFKLNHYGNLDNILINMAKSLNHRLSNPSAKHSCELLVSDLFKYHNYIGDIYELLCDKNLKNQKEGMRLYKLVAEDGGPVTNHIQVDYKALEKIYDWKDDDTKDAMEEAIEETEDAWKTVQEKVQSMTSV